MRLVSRLIILITLAVLALAAKKLNKKQETAAATVALESAEPPNAFDQRLPDCKKGFPRLQKKTKAKAIVCPMFR